jgi:hypothetical protein
MSSSSNNKILIAKLKGSNNYEVWSLHITAYLIKEGVYNAILTSDGIDKNIDQKALSNILLLIEDGPLLQIQHIDTAFKAWNSLKNLYAPQGFSSEFIICREFFNTTLNKYTSMEEYLNKVKQLSNQLIAKKLELLKQVIIT